MDSVKGKKDRKEQNRLRRVTEALCENLRETLQGLTAVRKTLKDAEQLLFAEINVKYPKLLLSETELPLLFEKSGAQMLAKRYLSDLTEEELEELDFENEKKKRKK